jgi:hypothetical protein
MYSGAHTRPLLPASTIREGGGQLPNARGARDSRQSTEGATWHPLATVAALANLPQHMDIATASLLVGIRERGGESSLRANAQTILLAKGSFISFHYFSIGAWPSRFC